MFGKLENNLADELYLTEQAEFRRVWEECAKLGECDGFGGRECRRKYESWKRAGKPSDRLIEFISG